MSISTYFQGSKPAARKKNIFISYREKDTAGETGRLADALKQYFDEDQIFMDIDKIEPGVDFTDVISRSLESCDVMLAVIGPNWASLKSSNSNTTRIKDPNDWVRLEIATALQRNIRVVPVLVDGATLPASEDLPDDLQGLLRRQAYEVSNKRWRYDTENLVAFLEKSVGIPTKHQHPTVVPAAKSSPLVKVIKFGLIGIGAIFILLIIIYAINGEGTSTQNTNNSIPNNNTTQQPVTSGGGTEQPQQEEPAPQTPASPIDVDGVWDDRSGVYYIDIEQTGNNLKLATYAMTGQQTGEGTGILSGNKLTYKLYFFNVGTFDFETTVSNDGSVIQGTFVVENNGARYTEPIYYKKRS